MTTLTGASTRTITGYLVTLLEYPRWLIEREVDFTNCHLQGHFGDGDAICMECRFGEACRWLTQNRTEPSVQTPLPDLVAAVQTAAAYVRGQLAADTRHECYCECDTCDWLREASGFLRTHRNRT